MPTSHPPPMRRDNRRNTFPARAGARGSGTKLAQHARHATSPGTKFTLQAQNLPIWRVLLLLGEFYPVFVANKPSMASFLPLPPTTSPARHQSRYKTHPAHPAHHQFRYKTRPARPKCPNLARFALAGRVLSRFCCQQAEHGEFSPAQTPAPPQARKKQHPPHNTRNHAMKYYPPPLHTQHHTMKHLPPQHATNNQNSATFTMQGRTFFHNTHHTPTPGRHFFQPTPLPAK